MAKRKRTFSATFLASYVPTWVIPAWTLLTLVCVPVAYFSPHSGLPRVITLPLLLSLMVLLHWLTGVKPRPAEIVVGTSGVQMDGALRLLPPLLAYRTHRRGKVAIVIKGKGGHMWLIDVSKDDIESILKVVSRTRSVTPAA